jgi:hypothetical protein
MRAGGIPSPRGCAPPFATRGAPGARKNWEYRGFSGRSFYPRRRSSEIQRRNGKVLFLSAGCKRWLRVAGARGRSGEDSRIRKCNTERHLSAAAKASFLLCSIPPPAASTKPRITDTRASPTRPWPVPCETRPTRAHATPCRPHILHLAPPDLAASKRLNTGSSGRSHSDRPSRPSRHYITQYGLVVHSLAKQPQDSGIAGSPPVN